MLATVVTGKTDLSDVLLLIAVILFVIVFVIRVMERALDSSLVALGLAFVALGWLVL